MAQAIALEIEYLDRQTWPLYWIPGDGADKNADSLHKPNLAERSTCVNHPVECLTAREIQKWAERVSEDEGERTGLNTNAYRHTLWQARLTLELGEDRAIVWADAHEAYLKDGQRFDHMADLYNNARGREIGGDILDRATAAEFQVGSPLFNARIISEAKAYVESESYAKTSYFKGY
ncbi:DUF6973 domain-containing protein [Streptomyces sp. NPDC055005]